MQSELRLSFYGLMGSLRVKWKNYLEKRAAINELANCDPSEVARISEDLGVSSGELRFLAASDKGAAELLKCRLQARRIDPTSVDPAVMRDLQLHARNAIVRHALVRPPIFSIAQNSTARN